MFLAITVVRQVMLKVTESVPVSTIPVSSTHEQGNPKLVHSLKSARRGEDPSSMPTVDEIEAAVSENCVLMAAREQYLDWTYVGSDVLSVDDSPIIRKCLQTHFESCRTRKKDGRKRKLKFEFAESGQGAVDLVVKGGRTFGVILMDKEMPNMDGIAATRILRQSG